MLLFNEDNHDLILHHQWAVVYLHITFSISKGLEKQKIAQQTLPEPSLFHLKIERYLCLFDRCTHENLAVSEI